MISERACNRAWYISSVVWKIVSRWGDYFFRRFYLCGGGVNISQNSLLLYSYMSVSYYNIFNSAYNSVNAMLTKNNTGVVWGLIF
jgi:hypothetical protein